MRIAAVILAALAVSSCSLFQRDFTVVSGSENETLEHIITDFGRSRGYRVTMKYKGSVDIMLMLEDGAKGIDAVWPANGLWIALGDKHRVVREAKSVMTSPVVFGIRRSLAQKLGFVGRRVSVREILAAIRAKKLKFMMTSATQSNSGASAYIGFLYALLGNPAMISKDDLHRPELRASVRELLAGIHRSSGSSGWLKDLFLTGDYDAMVNYEALIIEANKVLVKEGREPLYVVYPEDGIVLADSPLGFIDSGDSAKKKFFGELQKHLLSDAVQAKMLAAGRRTGFGGDMGSADAKVFDPAWGIDKARVLSPIPLPQPEVILEALNLYQTEFRKPSLTVFCLDCSGSMGGAGETQMKDAMRMLLDAAKARRYLIQSAREDRFIVIPFSDRLIHVWESDASEASLADLMKKIDGLSSEGSTDIYSPVIEGLSRILRSRGREGYIPAVILMTDGESNSGKKISDLKAAVEMTKLDIPVFSIRFGDASEKQLAEITTMTRARIFNGKTDLIGAFRAAKGYN